MSAKPVSGLANQVQSSIVQALTHGSAVVFPSELAAQFWRRRLLATGVLRVVREDRILSWDRFKEQAFDLRTDQAPVNSVWRELFVRQVLEKNADQPFLTAIVPPAYADNAAAFRQLIGRTLPALRAFVALEEASGDGGWLRALAGDLNSIYERYRAFLTDHGLYEPRWLAAAPAFLGGSYLLVFPELAEDWPQFADALARCDTVPVPDPAPDTLVWYENSRHELRSVFSQIGLLLDAGVAAADVVLTVCDLDEMRPRVAEQARLLGIPVSFAAGIPLSQSLAGRLLRAMQEAARSGFAVDALKPLLLTPAVPWKHYPTNAAAILAGVAAGAVGGTGRRDAGWRRLQPGPERDFTDRLLTVVPSLVQAPSASELRVRYLRFATEFFDADRWNPEDERALQRAVEELRGLAELEQHYSITVPDPFRFWLEQLEQTMYVPTRREAGVTVAPYRVSAGMNPAYHFVINAHQSATTVRVDPFPFLSDAQREQLGERTGARDLTDLFLAGYACSGDSVRFSGSAESFSGPALQPGLFVVSGAAAPPPELAPDSWYHERSAQWVPAGTVYPLQRAGARAYSLTEGRSGADFTRSTIESEELQASLLSRQSPMRSPGFLLFSAGDLERFFACPFGYLLSRPLALRDLDFSVDTDSPRELGTLYHDTLEAFFKELSASGAPFQESRLDEYAARLRALLAEKSQRAKMIPPEAHEARLPFYERVVDRVLEIDAHLIDGHVPQYVEAWERVTLPELQTVLVGRIDRVTRSPEGTLTLVDYKKGGTPSARELNAGSRSVTGVRDLPEDARAGEAARLQSVQIPLYVLLLSSHGERVETAALVSLEKDGLVAVMASPDGPVAKKAVMDHQRMEEIQLLLRDRIRQTGASIRDGDYRCADECTACPFRGVCRAAFVVR